jgi:WD40 repeat protein
MRVTRLGRGRIRGLWFAPDGRTLVAAGGIVEHVYALRAYDLVADRAAWSRQLPPCQHFAVAQDLSRTVWVSSEGDDLRVVTAELPGGPPRPVVPQTIHRLTMLTLTPDGRQVAVSGLADDPRIHLWGLTAPEQRPLTDTVAYGVAFSPTGGWYAVWAGEARVYNLTREVVARPFRPDGVRSAVFAPAGDLLATVSGRTVELWEVPAGRRRAVLDTHRNRVTAVAFAPDGRTLLTAALDGVLRLWDTADGRCRHELAWGLGGLHAVAFAPDGLTAAAGGEGGQVVLWDVG